MKYKKEPKSKNMAPSVAALPAACALEYTSFSRNKPMAAKALIKAPSTTKLLQY